MNTLPSSESMALPSSSEFMAEFGIAKPSTQVSQAGAQALALAAEKRKLAESSAKRHGVSQEMLSLLTQYCATMIHARELSQINWGGLANRLGTEVEFLEEAAKLLDQDGTFWEGVLGERIKRASASRVFRDASWERLEHLAVNRLLELAEAKMIRDTGELLAIASHARKANTDKITAPNGGNTVNINIGGDSMGIGDNGLPGAGAKMTLDLTPRMAQSLAQRTTSTATNGSRVIDGQMLTAQELRSVLELKKESAHEDSTEASQDFEGVAAEDSDSFEA